MSNPQQDLPIAMYDEATQDFIVQNKSNTLGSQQRKMSNGKKYVESNKKTIFQMIMEAINLRDQATAREPTSKEFGTLIMLGAMFLLFVISVTGFCVMWFTEYYNNKMLQELILTENSETANSWINPDPKYDTILKAHIFNYTNINDYLAGRADKIKVDDVGPLTYQEHTVKKKVVFNANNTVTFRDHKSYKFLPEKSKIGEDDVVILPNVPLLSAAYLVERMSFMKRHGAKLMIRSQHPEVFKKLKARELLWGYHDGIVSLDFGSGKTKFGLLMNRNGTSADSLQINTGVDDIRKFSIITQFNGMPALDYWTGDECNRIDGSEPSMFPPHLLEHREPVNVFLQVLCRKVPLYFEKEVTIYDNIDALRYRTPMNVFGKPEDNPANECYCQNTERCFPSGVINATKCYNDAPIYPSFPHFFSGDPEIYKDFEGIQPNAELHQTYADVHPRFAFPISGASRIQINIMLHKTSLLRNEVDRMENGMILPLIWIEITSGDFSQEVLDTLYISTFGLNAIQMALKYGTLLVCVTSFSLIVYGIYFLNRRREAHDKKVLAEQEALNGIPLPHAQETEITTS